MGRRVRWAVSSAVLCAALAVAAVAAAAPATGAPGDPVPAGGGIQPGVQMRTDGSQCTANFVFADGPDLLIGYAAHCAGTGGSTETNGCTSDSLPLGTPVEIAGASQPGTLAYSSWLAMRQANEQDPDACAFNDFALVKIADADKGRVSPEVPIVGGPSGIDMDGVAPGETVRSYGNSELRGGLTFLSPKIGTTTGTEGNGWTHTVLTLTPGIPGDSGSAFLSDGGQALGVLSTLNLAPGPGTNGVSDLNKMLDYARASGQSGAQLVTAAPAAS